MPWRMRHHREDLFDGGKMFRCVECGAVHPFKQWKTAYILKNLYYLESEPVYDEKIYCGPCFFESYETFVREASDFKKLKEGLWNRGLELKTKQHDGTTSVTMKFLKRQVTEDYWFDWDFYNDLDKTKEIVLELLKKIPQAEWKWWRFDIKGIPRKILWTLLHGG